MQESIQEQCPEDKLKFYSYIEELQTSRRRLAPLTPQRQPKGWIVDPWDPPNQDLLLTKTDPRPLKRNSLGKGLATPTRQCKMGSSPVRVPVEKENKQEGMGLLLSSRKQKVGRVDKSEEEGPFKVVLSSVLYPVVRREERGCEKRRIDRFHSFVARSVRR